MNDEKITNTSSSFDEIEITIVDDEINEPITKAINIFDVLTIDEIAFDSIPIKKETPTSINEEIESIRKSSGYKDEKKLAEEHRKMIENNESIKKLFEEIDRSFDELISQLKEDNIDEE